MRGASTPCQRRLWVCYSTENMAFKEATMTPTLTTRQRILNVGVTAAKYFKRALNNNTKDNIFRFLFKDEDNQNIII